MMIIPGVADGELFAINVFRVRPENQPRLIECIRSAAEAAGDVPGLVSQHLLCSEDGTQVANFMHWSTMDAFATASAENPVIAATRTAVHDIIEGDGPQRFDAVTLKKHL